MIRHLSLKIIPLLILGIALGAPALSAQGPEDGIEDSWDGVPLLSLRARTLAPFFAGVGLQLHASPNLRIGIDLGKTPGAYADAIASAGTKLKGHSQYRPIVVGAFSESSLYRAHLRYVFEEDETGWAIEAGLSQMTASNTVKISDVAAITSASARYSEVEAAAVAAGYRPSLSMKTRMLLADVMVLYQWDFNSRWQASVGGGIAKVSAADVDLKSNIPDFDSSKLGMALLNLSESVVASGIEHYGLSPLASIDIAYIF